jgi:ppGpp synthetase/RelA/SpoT-type nucleotidyltranferase
MHGYVAVHVVVFPQDAPIEIQIRTAWQHEWAEVFEKLADLVGRGIRYGQPPRVVWTPEEFDALDAGRQELARVTYGVRMAAVHHAMAIATLIDTFERAEDLAPDIPDLAGFRGAVEERLARFRESVESVERL